MADAEIWVKVYLPSELLQEFFQYIRDFDTSHNDCHFEILADSRLAEEEVNQTLDSIEPRLPFKAIFPGKKRQ